MMVWPLVIGILLRAVKILGQVTKLVGLSRCNLSDPVRAEQFFAANIQRHH